MEKLKKTAILNALGIVGIIGGTTALVVLNILNGWAFILAAIACFPMAKQLWLYAGFMHRNTIRILRKALPKAGFSIESAEWNDKHTTMRFYGSYQDEKFMIDAEINNAYIMICDKPWCSVKLSDPKMPKVLEAINEVNSIAPNISVVLYEPDDKDIRLLSTLSRTILPTYHPDGYLDGLFCDMLNCRPAFVKAAKKERPYMEQRRGTVGFNVETTSTNSEEEEIEPAAKSKPEVKD